MKSFVERAIQVEKLKTELVAAEVNLDTERNLLIAKGLKEVDLDSELGCGSWRP
jgi:ribosomal protein L12E/L44/L45/RPP1/RPP2